MFGKPLWSSIKITYQFIRSQCTLSLPSENIKKPQGFLMLQGVEKDCIRNKSVNSLFSSNQLILITHWEISQNQFLLPQR